MKSSDGGSGLSALGQVETAQVACPSARPLVSGDGLNAGDKFSCLFFTVCVG